MGNSDVLLIRVAELLAERTSAGPIRRWTKPGASRPATNHDEIAAAIIPTFGATRSVTVRI